MTLTKAATPYQGVQFNKTASGERAAKNSNVRRIQKANLKACHKDMTSLQIIGYTAWNLMVKHRVGLLSMAVIAMASYIAYDKFLHMFF